MQDFFFYVKREHVMPKYSTATKVGPPRGEDFFLEKKKDYVQQFLADSSVPTAPIPDRVLLL